MTTRETKWREANKLGQSSTHYVRWFIDAIIESKIPTNMASLSKLREIAKLFQERDTTKYPVRFHNDKETIKAVARLINSNLRKLGCISFNKIGGKLNVKR